VERETTAWELLHGGARSLLPDEYERAVDALASQPYLGVRLAGRRHRRKLLLQRTGFFVVYEVKPRLRLVKIASIIPKRSLGHRR
jgi:hypothetical protein